jgi:hypothetical protein
MSIRTKLDSIKVIEGCCSALEHTVLAWRIAGKSEYPYWLNTTAAGQSAMDGDNLDRVTELRLSPVQNSLS